MNGQKDLMQAQIQSYLASLPIQKRRDLEELHLLIQTVMQGCRIWFLEGRDASGKIVSNPNIGYGQLELMLAGGKTKTFYQIGISANTTGISVYLMGLKDKKYLMETYQSQIGKASVTSYCIKFKTLKDLDLSVLTTAIKDVSEKTSPGK